MLEGPNGFLLEHALVFKFHVSNNQAEYEALVAGLQLAKDMGVQELICRTDSRLVVGQMTGEFQVKDDQLLRYFHRASTLAAGFHKLQIQHIPRESNAGVDLLSKLSQGKEKGQLTTIIRQVLLQPTFECLHTTVTDSDDWREEIKQLMARQDRGETIGHSDARKVSRYVLVGEDLYRRGYSTPLLKCLPAFESDYVLNELHNGICGFHTGRRMLKAKAIRAGYFWPTMEEDAQKFVQKCQACQVHANGSNVPPERLHSIVSPWPFAQWGIDIVGPFPVGPA